MSKLDKPYDLKDLSGVLFDTKPLMPRVIPARFNDKTNPYYMFALKWFKEGVNINEFPPTKEGIELACAHLHIHVVLASVLIPIERRLGAAAYLLNKWFTPFSEGDLENVHNRETPKNTERMELSSPSS